MANPTDRLSMEDRYKKSNAGGAFDAKSAGKKLWDGIPNDFADGFTKGGVNTGLPKKDSIFSGKKLWDGIPNDFADGFTIGGANTRLPKKDSIFLKGHDKQIPKSIEKVSDSIFLKGHNSKKYKG